MFGFYKKEDLFLGKIIIASNIGGIMLDDINESKDYALFLKTKKGYRVIEKLDSCYVSRIIPLGITIDEISDKNMGSVFITEIQKLDNDNNKYMFRSKMKSALQNANHIKNYQIKTLVPLK